MIIQSNLPKLFKASGLTIWPFIFVVDKNDLSLIEHEKVHFSEQWKLLVIGWWALYFFSFFRLKAELRAYKVQIKYGLKPELAAYWLSTNYYLTITQEEALNLLKE